jgi:hypothetical protein
VAVITARRTANAFADYETRAAELSRIPGATTLSPTPRRAGLLAASVHPGTAANSRRSELERRSHPNVAAQRLVVFEPHDQRVREPVALIDGCAADGEALDAVDLVRQVLGMVERLQDRLIVTPGFHFSRTMC